MGYLITLLAVLSAVTGLPNFIPEDKWWQHIVIYEIYPQSFYDSDGNGTGDIKGITKKIDYLKDLGIGAIWLNPFYPSPGLDNGYDISNYTEVDPELGTMADFDELVATCSSTGIKVIVDFVPNHTSDQHEWFKKSVAREKPYEDYYVWKDAKATVDGKPEPPNDWDSIFKPGEHGSAWKWNQEREQFYYHAFREEQPDLNLRNPEVVKELKNVVEFWVKKGVKGFRVDAVLHMFEDEQLRDQNGEGHKYTQNLPETFNLVKQLRKYLEELDKDLFLTTEGYTDPENTMRYYGSTWEPGANFPFNFLLLTDVNDKTDAPALHKVIVEYLTNLKRSWFPNWVSGNHDWPRIPSRMGGTSTTDQIHMIHMLLPGTSTIYMGDELGMDSYWNLDREECPEHTKYDYRTPNRTPFCWNNTFNAGFTTSDKPWLPVNPECYNTNVEIEVSSTACNYRAPTHLRNFKELLKLKSTEAIKLGRFRSYVLNDQVYAFTRSDNRIIHLVLLNLSKKWSKPFNLAEQVPEVQQQQFRSIVARSSNIGELCSQGSDCNTKLFSGTWNMPPKSGVVVSFSKTQSANLRTREPDSLSKDCEPYWMAHRKPSDKKPNYC